MAEDETGKLVLEFDMNTIDHLGIKMYSTLPPVLGELVANAWDADADEVSIFLDDEDIEHKKITIIDKGEGMNVDDINNKFLKIGRNRRIEERSDTTGKGRKIIGKKGIGKLSIFGITDEVYITSTKSGIINKFGLNFPDIKKSGKKYYPPHLIVDKETDDDDGVIVELLNIKRKSKFDVDGIISDLAQRFIIYDESFIVNVYYNGNEIPIVMNNNMRFSDLDVEFEWTFPNDRLNSDYEYKERITGNIFTATKSVKSAINGIYLMARGKIVNKNDFYGLKTFQYSHAYMTGWLNIDFIEDGEEDYVSSNRESLIWELDITARLKEYIREILKFVDKEWRVKRREKTETKIQETTGIDIKSWITNLPKNDQKLAKKTTDIILDSKKLSPDKSAEIIGYIKDSFEFTAFREFAAQIQEFDEDNQEEFITFFKDWELTEAKELYRLALVRIEAINKFDQFIREDAREVPTLHDFFKSFSWILDPRIMNFKDEVTYSSLLRDKFIEVDEIESDKRIDFLCVDFASTLFIIELKRPSTRISHKHLDQALDYAAYIEKHAGTDAPVSIENIEVIIIGGGLVNDPGVQKKAKSFRASRTVLVRTYIELLSKARNYHQEFIEKYDELQQSRN